MNKIKIIKPPHFLPVHRVNGVVPNSVFLAGSIEMGTAEDWQSEITNMFIDSPIYSQLEYIFNPRRNDWDFTCKQSPDNPKFHEQVSWEMTALDISQKILMYFSPKAKSPISLLELGLYAKSGKMLVICPESFWRSGNVYMVCERYNIICLRSINELEQYVNLHNFWK